MGSQLVISTHLTGLVSYPSFCANISSFHASRVGVLNSLVMRGAIAMHVMFAFTARNRTASVMRTLVDEITRPATSAAASAYLSAIWAFARRTFRLITAHASLWIPPLSARAGHWSTTTRTSRRFVAFFWRFCKLISTKVVRFTKTFCKSLVRTVEYVADAGQVCLTHNVIVSHIRTGRQLWGK